MIHEISSWYLFAIFTFFKRNLLCYNLELIEGILKHILKAKSHLKIVWINGLLSPFYGWLLLGIKSHTGFTCQRYWQSRPRFHSGTITNRMSPQSCTYFKLSAPCQGLIVNFSLVASYWGSRLTLSSLRAFSSASLRACSCTDATNTRWEWDMDCRESDWGRIISLLPCQNTKCHKPLLHSEEKKRRGGHEMTARGRGEWEKANHITVFHGLKKILPYLHHNFSWFEMKLSKIVSWCVLLHDK